MASTYTPIAIQTLSTSAATVTFSSIPGTYTDLILVASPTALNNNYDFAIRYNSDSGGNYSWTTLKFNADESASPISQRGTNDTSIATRTNINSSVPFPIVYQVLNYANSSTYKSSLSRIARSDYATAATVGLWRSTSAINSITCVLTGGGSTSFASGSTFTLYGVLSA